MTNHEIQQELKQVSPDRSNLRIRIDAPTAVTGLAVTAAVAAMLVGEVIETQAQNIPTETDTLVDPTATPDENGESWVGNGGNEAEPTVVAVVPTTGAREADSVPTNTDVPPTATPTPSPEASSTPAEVAAVVDVVGDGLVTVDTLRQRFPDTYRVAVDPMAEAWGAETIPTVHLDWDNLSRLVGPDGHTVRFGFYVNSVPVNPEAVDYTWRTNNVIRQEAFGVGVATNFRIVHGQNADIAFLTVSIPIEATGQMADIIVPFEAGSGARIMALDAEGNPLGLPAGVSAETQRIPYGTNPTTSIVYDEANNVIRFPTPNGVSEIRLGDPVTVGFAFNVQEIGGIAARTISQSDGMTPEQWIPALSNSNRSDDCLPRVYSQSLIVPFTPINSSED
jgi:hypothetical protein